ncbi:unnamed protein product [Brassica oleracea var. botrytis]
MEIEVEVEGGNLGLRIRTDGALGSGNCDCDTHLGDSPLIYHCDLISLIPVANEKSWRYGGDSVLEVNSSP